MIKQEEALALFQETLAAEVRTLSPIKIRRYRWRTGKGTPETMVLLLSDTHIGHKTRSFNISVFNQRLRALEENLMRITRVQIRDHPVDNLVILVLGDIIQNDRIGQLISLDELQGTVWEQMKVALTLFPEFFVNLLAAFKRIDIYCVAGNHGSLGKFAGTTTNWDLIIYNFWQQNLANQPNIHFHLTEEFYQMVRIENKKFLCVHGDQIRMWMNIPFYGAIQAFMRWYCSIGRFDYGVCGHFHTIGNINWNEFELFLNGCFVTDDMYVLKRIKMMGTAAQMAFSVHPKVGVTARYHLYLNRLVR